MSMQQRISLTLAAKDRFSEAFDSASQSSLRLTQAARKTQKTLGELGQKTKLVNQYKAVSAQLSDTGEKLLTAKRRLKLLKSGEADAGVSAREHAQAIRKAERDVNSLNKAYGSQAQKLAGLRRGLDSAGLKVDALGAEELRLARRTKEANAALEKQKHKLGEINAIRSRIDSRTAARGELMGQAAKTAVMAAPMVMAGKRAIDYETKFADVKKVVDFESPKEERQYRRQMMTLAGELGVEQAGLVDIVTAAGQSGIEKDQLLKFAENATKMSVAWDVSSAEAGETLATWRAAMGLTQAGALDLANATNYLSNNMNAKAKQIAGVVVRQGSTAMQAGFSSNESAALAAGLIAGGATEETASTAMKNITGALTSGYAATGSQTDAMERLGFNPEDLASSMQEDAKGTLIEVLESLQNVEAKDRGAIISELFGTEVKGAVAKLVKTLDDNKNGLKAAFARVAKDSDRANSVNKEYDNVASTRGHQLNRLKSKFDDMTVALGDRLLPAVDVIVPHLISAVDWVADLAKESPKLTSALMGVAAGYAAIKAGWLAFKVAKLTMGNLTDRGRLFKTKLSGTTDQTALSAQRATRALDRLNRKLNQLGGGSLGGGGSRRRSRHHRRGSSRRTAITEPLFSARQSTPINRPKFRLSGRMRSMGALFGGAALTNLLLGGDSGESGSTAGMVANEVGLAALSGELKGATTGQPHTPKATGKLHSIARQAKALPASSGTMLGKIAQAPTQLASSAGRVISNSVFNVAPMGGAAMLAPSMGSSSGAVSAALPVNRSVGSTLSKMGNMGGKLFRPLGALMSGAALVDAVANGDAKDIGGTTGNIAGGLGGASAGAMAGAALGSVVPVIGTAVGGLLGSVVGGFSGGELGGWLGEKIGGWFSEDKTEQPAPESVTKKTAQVVNATRSVTFNPTINITPSGDPIYDQKVANDMVKQMKSELTPILMGDSTLDARADANLSDRSDT